MLYQVKKQNLFAEEIINNYYLVHCISADFALGKGIAVEFNKRFNLRNKLNDLNPNYLSGQFNPDCILIDRVFNLITKERYWHKPTYISMLNALIKLKQLCQDNQINKLAMPTIGCGLDKLNWNKVQYLIKSVFNDTKIDIIVCVK